MSTRYCEDTVQDEEQDEDDPIYHLYGGGLLSPPEDYRQIASLFNDITPDYIRLQLGKI